MLDTTCSTMLVHCFEHTANATMSYSETLKRVTRWRKRALSSSNNSSTRSHNSKGKSSGHELEDVLRLSFCVSMVMQSIFEGCKGVRLLRNLLKLNSCLQIPQVPIWRLLPFAGCFFWHLVKLLSSQQLFRKKYQTPLWELRYFFQYTFTIFLDEKTGQLYANKKGGVLIYLSARVDDFEPVKVQAVRFEVDFEFMFSGRDLVLDGHGNGVPSSPSSSRRGYWSLSAEQLKCKLGHVPGAASEPH